MVDLLGLTNLVDFSIISAALGVLAGVINSIFASRRAEKQRHTEIETRRAQLFMGLYEKYRERDFRLLWNQLMFQWEWEDYDDWRQKYGSQANPKAWSINSSMMGFFEGIGVLLKYDLIDIDLVHDLVGNLAIRFWERNKPIVVGQRKQSGIKMWKDYEYLYNLLKNQHLQTNK